MEYLSLIRNELNNGSMEFFCCGKWDKIRTISFDRNSYVIDRDKECKMKMTIMAMMGFLNKVKGEMK